MTLKEIFMKLFYHKKKKEAKLNKPYKMGENEKSLRLLINSLDRLVIRHRPFMELCETEGAFRELENILTQNLELLVSEKQNRAMRHLIREGAAKPVNNLWHIIKGEKT